MQKHSSKWTMTEGEGQNNLCGNENDNIYTTPYKITMTAISCSIWSWPKLVDFTESIDHDWSGRVK